METTILIDCILCLLGIAVYFLNRYANRSRKGEPSLRFWYQDNWPELYTTVILNAALMIIIHLPDTYISLDRLFSAMPVDIHIAGISTFSFFLGLGLTATFYRIFKSKLSKQK